MWKEKKIGSKKTEDESTKALFLISKLKKQVEGIEEVEKELKKSVRNSSPQKTKKMLEEIIVPSLEVLRDEKKPKRPQNAASEQDQGKDN